MNAFTIDTGIASLARQHMPDWFIDQHAADAPDNVLFRSYADHLVGQIEGYKRQDRARGVIISHLSFLRDLAAVNPAAFDHVITAYADKLAEQPQSAPGGTGQQQLDKDKHERF